MSVPDPPSVRVADALRERIRSGALAPGDRVPSTREITREWGIAMATATKVLTALRDDGLVRPVPGVGTVVQGPGHRARPDPRTADGPRSAPDTGLTADRVVAAATAVADAEGLAALSMRRVAVELGVATMSLYRHVGDKDDLLIRMMDAAFDEWTGPAGPPDGWRERVEQPCRAMWLRFRRHPWLASAFSLTRPQPLAGGMTYSDQILRGLAELGMSTVTAFDTQLILFNFVRGIAVSLESEQQAEADTGRTADEWIDDHTADTDAAMATRQVPALRDTVTRLGRHGYDLDLDALFETGLTYLLDGIAARHS